MMDRPEDYLADYLKSLQARGLRYIHSYRWAAGRFLRYLKSKALGLSEIKPENVRDYLSVIQSQRYAQETQRDILTLLRHFLKHTCRQGWISKNPAAEVSRAWQQYPGGYEAYQGVLRKLFTHPHWAARYRLALFDPYWEKYLQTRLDQGYGKVSFRVLMGDLYRFHEFLRKEAIDSLREIGPGQVSRFLRLDSNRFHQQHGRKPTAYYRRRTKRHIQGFLRYCGFPTPERGREPTPQFQGPLSGFLQAYLNFARHHQGLRSSTIEAYAQPLMIFQSFLIRRRIHKIQELKAAHCDGFLLAKSPHRSVIQKRLTALRSFLRFLYAQGCLGRDLAQALIPPCSFQADRYPKYIPWAKIEKLLSMVGRASPDGKMDYATLTLMACHGPRRSEVISLDLDDADLEKGSLWLRNRKNGSSIQLPLSTRCQQALADYLTIRPHCSNPRLFLTLRAPWRPLTKTILDKRVRWRLKERFGNSLPAYGCHVLRHSFAKAMLDRGAPLSHISVLLGHQALQSTYVYTRISIEEMREVADNYACLLVPPQIDKPAIAHQ